MADEYEAEAEAAAAAAASAAAPRRRRHRFQTVHERVQALQRELQLHAKSSSAAGSGREDLTFLEELRLQSEMTTLETFQALSRTVAPLVATTPQLLHHLPKVVAVLRAEIEQATAQGGGVTTTAQDVQRERLVPALKLVTALARELRKEFYPHFATMLPLIVAVIDTKDPELSTHAFKTLAMLFHYLRAQLLADMDAVHKCYFPLLGHPREFVREFAAQTLAVLLRRVDTVKQLRKYLGSYLGALTRGSGKDDEILLDGSAKLFFALVRNVNHGFHSRMRDIVLFLLGAFRPKGEDDAEHEDKDSARAAIFAIVSKTCELMTRHTDADHASELLECLALAVTKAMSILASKSASGSASSTASALYLSRLVTIFWMFVRFRGGKLVLEGDAKQSASRVTIVHDVCRTLLTEPSVILCSPSLELRDVTLNLYETAWRVFPAPQDDTSAQVSAFFDAASAALADDKELKNREYWCNATLAFIRRTLSHDHVKVAFVKAFVFPKTVQFAFTSLLRRASDISAFSTVVAELGDYIKRHGDDIIDGNRCVVMSKGQCFIKYPEEKGHIEKLVLRVGSEVVSAGINSASANDGSLALAWQFCKSLALIRVDDDKLIAFVTPLIVHIQKAEDSASMTTANLRALEGELWRLLQIARYHRAAVSEDAEDFVQQTLHKRAGSYVTLSALLDTLRWKIGESGNDPRRGMLSKHRLPGTAELLFANLRSPSHALRMVSLEVMAQFESLEYFESPEADVVGGSGSFFSGPCELMEIYVALERACATIGVETEREVVRLLTRVKILGRSPQTPLIYKKIAVNLLLGLYHVKFATIWPHISEALEAIARVHFADIWTFISVELIAASWRQEPSTASGVKPVIKDAPTPSPSSAASVRAEFEAVCKLEQGRVDASASTDAITHHSLLWKGMEKIADLVETKTKFVVPLFLVYLRDQYRSIYPDEFDRKRMTALNEQIEKIETKEQATGTVALFAASTVSHWLQPQSFARLTTKSVRNKLIDWLNLFGSFRNLKGAFAQGFLHDFFFDLLVKSDEIISKLALQCLYGFDKKHLAAYKTQLDRIADSATFREELTSFDIGVQGGVVLLEHRLHLVPVLMRILYSKCVSKKGRGTGDTVAARRAAILSYLAALESEELASFIELVVRAFNVKIEVGGESKTPDACVTPIDVAEVQPSRVLGFLNLLEDLIGQLGVKLSAFVPTIADVLLSVLKLPGVGVGIEDEDSDPDAETATPMDVDDSNEKGNEDDSDAHMQGSSAASDPDAMPKRETAEYTSGMRKQVRMLTMRRLAELIDTFDTLVSLRPWVADMLTITHDAVLRLPKTVVGADKASSLMELLLAIARADHSRELLPSNYIHSVVSCLSAGIVVVTSSSEKQQSSMGITPEMLDVVLQFMGSLLDGDEEAASQPTPKFQLIPHIPFVLRQFVHRFQAKAARYARDRYAGSARKELTFLCRLSGHLEHYTDKDENAIALSRSAAHDLFQLLLPFLQRSHRATDADKEKMLQVLAQIVPRLTDPSKHVLALTRLLAPGPNAVSERYTRARLVEVFEAIGRHPEAVELARVADLLAALNAYDPKRVEDVDFERRMDALNQINASSFEDLKRDSHLLAPIVAQYLMCMHDNDFAIRSAALAGLSTFVELSASQATAAENDSLPAVLNALESLVMPSVRVSLRTSNEDVRRGFVSLLGRIADFAETPESPLRALPYVHGDLALLRNREDPEADFFFNITHIQAHRKRRALQRLGSLMAEMGERQQQQQQQQTHATATEAVGDWFSNSTVNNILLPILLHFIYEAQSKSQESIQSEAASCIGRAAGLLRWSHYLALLRRLLKSIDGHEDSENAIIATVCDVIDHFHFAAPGAATEWEGKGAKKPTASSNANATEEKQTDSRNNAAIDGVDDDEDMDKEDIEDDAAAASSKVQDAMEAQVLPMLKKYLFKGVTARGSAKTAGRSGNSLSLDADAVVSEAVRVRVPLALAVVKVLRRLRAATFFIELPKLLVSFTRLLKSKDEAVRTSARVTLVKITQELGLTYLYPIVDELRHTLREGYMVHVLSYTLHSILEKVSTMVEHSKPASLLGTSGGAESAKDFASPLDACVPVMMELLVMELYHDALENQDGSAPHKSKMKEAKASGVRGFDSLELLARSIAFLPNPSIHAVLSALIDKYRALEAGHGGTGASASKALTILRDALKRVALGLSKNPAVERSYVCLLAYNLMTSSLETIRPATEQERARYNQDALVQSWLVNEKSAKATRALASNGRVRALDTAKVPAAPSSMTGYNRHDIGGALADDDSASTPASTTHLDELLTFSVLLVHSIMRKSPTLAVSTTSSRSQLPPALLDPLVPLLMRCAAEAKNDRAVIQSLKCLTMLLSRTDLSAMDAALDPLVRRLFKILQKAGAATHNEMVQTCYRALTAVLQARPSFRLTEAQLRVALSFVRADLDEREHQNATFALLRAVIASRLVVNEVYDVVLRVGELLVRSDGQSARANCRAVFVTFLLEYPLGAKRVAQHLNFLMNNLAYTYETGRSAVLEALGVLVKKLPAEMVNDRAQFFLLPLVLRLANDEAAACRALAGEAITTLLRRMGVQQLNESVQLIAKWWRVEPASVSRGGKQPQLKPGHEDSEGDAALPSIADPKLVCAAAQVTSLVLRARPESLARRTGAGPNPLEVLDNAARALVRSLADVQAAVESAAVDWQVAYHVVDCLLAWSEQLAGVWETWLASTERTEPGLRAAFVDEVALPLLAFPHAHVRLGALRLIGTYLRRREAGTLRLTAQEQVGRSHMARDVVKQGDAYLKRPGVLFALASGVCKLLERAGEALDDDTASEILATLPFLMDALAAFPDIPQYTPEDAGAEASDEDEAEDADAEGEHEGEAAGADTDGQAEQPKRATPVGWLLTRLSFVSRAAPPTVQTAVFKLFAALIATRDAAFVRQHVLQMLNPLFRASTATETAAPTAAPPAVPSAAPLAAPPSEPTLLAREVLALLEQKLGPTAFLEAYTLVQRKVAVFRAARKQQRKREQVTDPARAAARKMHKNDQKRRAKQLKKRKFALLKGSADARPRKAPRPGAE